MNIAEVAPSQARLDNSSACGRLASSLGEAPIQVEPEHNEDALAVDVAAVLFEELAAQLELCFVPASSLTPSLDREPLRLAEYHALLAVKYEIELRSTR